MRAGHTLAVVHRLPVAVDLGHGVGTPRMERRGLGLRDLGHLAVHLRRGRLIEADRMRQLANRLEQPQRAERIDVRRVQGRLKGHRDVRLRPEVVHFVGRNFAQQPAEPVTVREIAVMEEQSSVGLVGVEI